MRHFENDMHVNEHTNVIGDNLHITTDGYCSFSEAKSLAFISLSIKRFTSRHPANRNEILYASEQQFALQHGRARVRACAP